MRRKRSVPSSLPSFFSPLQLFNWQNAFIFFVSLQILHRLSGVFCLFGIKHTSLFNVSKHCWDAVLICQLFLLSLISFLCCPHFLFLLAFFLSLEWKTDVVCSLCSSVKVWAEYLRANSEARCTNEAWGDPHSGYLCWHTFNQTSAGGHNHPHHHWSSQQTMSQSIKAFILYCGNRY